MKKTRLIRALLLLAGSVGYTGLASAMACETLIGMSLPHSSIASATTVSATAITPAYCLVEAHSHPTSDSDIKILIALPTDGWNGKYLQTGNGGYAGGVSPPEGAVQRGYVGAATDNGHVGHPPMFDASWATGHPQQVIDFGYRSLKETTTVAKAVTEAFYGQMPRYSYFQGCSDGGREALMEAQRYPEDWDGIIAGAPANFWTHLLFGMIWNYQTLNNNPASSIPGAKLPAIQAAALGQCDAADGVVDGVVENPHQCRFDPAAMTCRGVDSNECLTTAQVSAVQKIIVGAQRPRNGKQVFPGYYFNAVADPNGLGLGPWIFKPGLGFPEPVQFLFAEQFFRYMAYNDPTLDIGKLNFTSDVAYTDGKLASILNSTESDLGPFQRRGAKLIMYHGWEDGAISPDSTVNYYNDVIDAQRHDRRKGSGADRLALRTTQEFARLFMVPGMLHCAAGPGPNTFDTLTSLEKWVERGVAPESIIATKYVNDAPQQGVVRTRPLCPYPKTAHYVGGDINVADNFVCVESDWHGRDD